jgi:hypothetical protein
MAFDLERYERYVDNYRAARVAPPLYVWSAADLCLVAIARRANRRGYVPNDIREDICQELRAAGLLSGRKHYKLTSLGHGRVHEVEQRAASVNNVYHDWADKISDEASDAYFALFPRD